MASGSAKRSEEAVEQLSRSLGERDPQTVLAMRDLVDSYRRAGRLQNARATQERIVAIVADLMVPQISSTQARTTLGNILDELGEHTEALRIRQSVFDELMSAYGPDNPATVATRTNLSNSLRALGEYSRLREVEEAIVASDRRRLGDHDEHTLWSMDMLCDTYSALGNYRSAAELGWEVLSSREEQWGPSDRRTLGTKVNLAGALAGSEDFGSAHRLMSEARDAARATLSRRDLLRKQIERNLALLEEGLSKLD